MKCKKRILLLALLLFSIVLIGGMNVQAKKKTKPKSLKKAKITLAKSSYTYNGKAKKPAVTVKLGKKKLKKNRDYTVKYTKNKNAEILTLDSMQSVTKKQIADGYTYLSAMEKNLEVLKAALN